MNACIAFINDGNTEFFAVWRLSTRNPGTPNRSTSKKYSPSPGNVQGSRSPHKTSLLLDKAVSQCDCSFIILFKKGETAMAEKGSKDKGKREQLKKPQLTPKEKRKLKKEKKNK